MLGVAVLPRLKMRSWGRAASAGKAVGWDCGWREWQDNARCLLRRVLLAVVRSPLAPLCVCVCVFVWRNTSNFCAGSAACPPPAMLPFAGLPRKHVDLAPEVVQMRRAWGPLVASCKTMRADLCAQGSADCCDGLN